MKNKIIVTILGILGLGGGYVALGANPISYTKDMYPTHDSTYYVGTTTRAYLGGSFDEICLAGDCQTSWSAGSFPDHLSQIGDVSTTTLANGSILKYETGTGWISAATSTLNITAPFSTTSADNWFQNDATLDEASNVDTTGISAGDILYWTGTEWVDTATSTFFDSKWTDNGDWLTPASGEGIVIAASSTFSAPVNGISIDEVENPTTDKTFTFDSNNLTFQFSTPSSGFSLEAIGNFSDHVLYVNQITGNPGVGSQLVHLHAEDADIEGLLVDMAAASTSKAIEVISGATVLTGGLTTMGNASTTLISGTSAWYTNFYGALSGNASTATALNANGANCDAGNAPLGVDASGAVEGCFDVWTEAENTAAGYTSYSDADVTTLLASGTTTVANLSITTAISAMGEYFTNFTTYVRSLFTGGNSITITAGSIAVDDDFLLNDGDTGTGTYDFSGATVKQDHYITITAPGFQATTTTATTTVELGTAGTAQTWNWADCRTTSGTTSYRIGDGTNWSNTINASTTESQINFSTNNSFTQGERRVMEVGPLTAGKLSCTLNYEDD